MFNTDFVYLKMKSFNLKIKQYFGVSLSLTEAVNITTKIDLQPCDSMTEPYFSLIYEKNSTTLFIGSSNSFYQIDAETGEVVSYVILFKMLNHGTWL